MKKRFQKLLSVLLAVCLMVSVCTVSVGLTAQATEKVTEFYVGFGGTGNGTNFKNPAPNVATAVATLNSLGLTEGDSATIYIVQDMEKPSIVGEVNAVERTYTAHNMAYWGNVPEHSAKIILKPYAENQKNNTSTEVTYLAISDALGKQDQMILNGPCEFDDLQIIYPYGSSIFERIMIVTNGHNAVFGENISYGYVNCTSANEQNWTGAIKLLSGNDTPIFLGKGIALSNKAYNKAFRLTMENYLYYQSSAIYIPNYATGNYTFNNDFTLEFTNSNQGPYVVLGTAKGTATTTFEKNLNFKITNPKANIRFKNGTDNVVVKGAVQLIASNGVKYALNANEPYPLTNITTLVKSDLSAADMWILNVDPEYAESIDFVEGEKGKFKVNENCIAYATDSNGKVVESKYGVLDLSEKSGEYSVEFKTLEAKVYDFYIKYGGATYQSGDVYGTDGTHLKPYATVGDVLKAINANDVINQEGNIVNVNVLQDITAIIGQKDRSHNMACWGETVPHKATIVLKDSGYNNYSGSVKSAYIAFSQILADQRQLVLSGPTVFDDIQMVYVSSSNVDAQMFVLGGNNVRITEKAKFANLNLNGNSFDKFKQDPGDITSLLVEKFIGTWIAADTTEQPVVYSDEVKVILDNGYTTSGNKAVFIGDSSSIFENDVTLEINIGDNMNTRVNVGKSKSEYVTVFEKNVNFKLRDSSSTDSDYFGFRPMSAVVVKGGMHLIKSDNVHCHPDNPYDNFDDSAFKVDGVTAADSWIINVSEADYDKIDFINGEKGKFAIDSAYMATAKYVAEEGEKARTVKSENGVLDLSDLTGEYKVTFKVVKDKTMFYYKEVKTKMGDTLLHQTKPLRAGVEYTMSFDYHINCEGFNDTFYVGFYGGEEEPGSSKIIKTQFFSTREQNENLFSYFNYNGKTATFKFTLTEEQIENHKYFYLGFRYLPAGAIITEAYFANMTLYETLDETKENHFLSDEFETTIDNWYSNRGATQSGNNTVFERSDLDFTACYLPYNEMYFETPSETHFGDSNLDGDIDLLDLVSIDEAVKANNKYCATVDANDDGVLDSDDLDSVKKHLIGKTIYNWTEREVGLMVPNEMSGGSDAQAEELKEQIMSAPDTLTKASSNNKVYYVAENGKASNDGLSQSKPINADSVNSLSLTAGDVVLFKRGDTMRLSAMITPRRGVSYGAYGEGDKPVLLGSLKNYADKTLWTTKDNNLWEVYLGTEDAGQVIFNNGEFLGYRKHTFEEVHFNGDYYYDFDSKKLYLYLNNINPAVYFASIEIATTSRAFGTWGSLSKPVNDLKFENLCMKYFSLFAFNISYTDGIDITGCEMGWIGGQITGSQRDRFGNAVQFWNASSNANVSNNYIYQIFDAALTFQGSVDNIYKNLTFKDNLIEYTSMNFEFWGTGSTEAAPWDGESDVMHNVKFEDNILRFSGYGWGGQQRKLKPNQAFVLAWNTKYEEGQIQDFTIKNNVFDVANSTYYYGENTFKHIDISANTYYQKSGSIHGTVKGNGVYCLDLASFVSEIKTVDSAPTKIEWVD